MTDPRSPGEIQVLACISCSHLAVAVAPPVMCVKNLPPPSRGDAKSRGPKFESRQINPDFNVLCHLSNIGSSYTLCRCYIPGSSFTPTIADTREQIGNIGLLRTRSI